MTDIWQGGKTYVPGALVKPSSTTVVAQPQPTNGDFETGDLTGWAQGASRWTNTSTTPYAGTKCVVLSGSGIDSLNNTNVVPVRPGQRITAQAMAKLTNSGTNDQGAQIIIVWLDASNAEIPGAATIGSLIYGQGGYWKLTTASGMAPAGAVKAFIRLNGNNGTHGGTLEFDQVSWDYAYQTPPPGLVFKATQAAPGKSGSAEPAWPTTAGISVTDNEVTWEGVIAARVVWEASPIMQTGAVEPTWPLAVGAIVHDGNMDWVAVSSQITDKNCPHSKVVAIMASKVFAADKDIVRFSATVNPLDWTSAQDAGYLPTGLQQANSNDMAVLAPYRSNLTTFNASSFQNWQVDPDPSAMSLLDQMDGIGSSWQHAAQPVGNDLFYLSQLGVRSVGIAAGTDNLAAGDIGMPVDVLVRDSIRIATANGTPVLATYYPSAGQYWLAVRALQPLAITGDLPSGLPGDVVSYQYAVSGGVLPRTVSIVTGVLPAGLSMSTSGLVTGTRTTLGSYAWTVRAVDADGALVDLADTSATVDDINTAIAADAPLLHWPLTETSGTVANDLSGNGYNGTYSGGVKTASGFQMTAYTDNVTAATGSASGSPLDVGTGRAWAIEAVVTRGATQPFDNVAANIAAQWRSPNFGYASMGLSMPSTGKVATSFLGYFTPSNLSSPMGVGSATAPVNGARTHVYMERVQGSGATDTLNIYVNGALSNTASVPSTSVGTASNGAQFVVGYATQSYGWLGTVEHVAVYNHSLGAARALYHAQLLGLA